MLMLISLRNVAYLIGNQYISVAKQRNIENLSMNKDRHIISELNNFFAESNNTKAIQGIMNVLERIHINHRQMDFAKAANSKFTTSQVLELTVTEKIWGILMDVFQAIAEDFHFNQDEMMRAIMNNNNKELNAVRRAFEALQLAA